LSIAYIRVSTREQDEKIQRKAILDFAERKRCIILEWYIDAGQSGAKPFKSRPEASRLLNELERIKPKSVIVFALDRLGRDMQDTVNTVLELEEKGIKVISVKEEWMQSLDPNIRKLILSIMAWVAEFERRRIRERQLAAWRAGKQKGRPSTSIPWGDVLKRLEKEWTKKNVWRWLVTDRKIKISYEQFLRRLNKYMKKHNIIIKHKVVKTSNKTYLTK